MKSIAKFGFKGDMMRKLGLVFVTIGIFLLSGCSYKSSSIDIKPYQVSFLSFKNTHKSVYINSFKDERTNKKIVAVVTNNDGDNLGYTTSNVNFGVWYKNALKKALNANGFIMVTNPKNATFKINLVLNKLFVTFNKSELIKENLTGTISLQLIIKKGNETITKTISENISKYNGLTVSNETFQKQIEALLNDSIKLIIKNLSDI